MTRVISSVFKSEGDINLKFEELNRDNYLTYKKSSIINFPKTQSLGDIVAKTGFSVSHTLIYTSNTGPKIR